MPLPNGKPTYYEFFGLPNYESDPIKIKKAYRTMALKHHPDRCDDKAEGERMMKQVNEIYKVLTSSKAEYDRHLRRKLNIINTESTRPESHFDFVEEFTAFKADWEEVDVNPLFYFNFGGQTFNSSAQATAALRRRIRIKKLMESLTDIEIELCEKTVNLYRQQMKKG